MPKNALWILPFALIVVGAAPDAPEPPTLPQFLVDTTPVTPPGETIAVPSGGDLQRALDSARPGDVVVLAAGATYRGPFTLKAKDGPGWVTIRTSTPDESLPPGARIDPKKASLLAALESSVNPVLGGPGAHHVRLIGLEIRPRAGSFLTALVDLTGTDHVILDRCFIHGDPQKGARRGVAANSTSTGVIESYLSDFKEQGADSQAIAAWNGEGPFAIIDNDLEAAGENILFGGADPSTQNLVPSDIVIRGNLVRKPLAWKAGEEGYDGSSWSVKNLLELKNARRVLVEQNVFENGWAQSQNGFAILFTVRNQEGTAPWSTVEDVTFRNNIVRHAGAGVNLLGKDTAPSGPTRRVQVSSNLFEDIGGDRWGGPGTLVQVLQGVSDLVFDHNTAFQTGNILTAEGDPNPRFAFRNNICPHNAYGIAGTGTAPDQSSLEAYFPGALVHRNVIIGGSGPSLAGDNFFPPSVDAVGFSAPSQDNWGLGPSSPYKGKGTDGRDPGMDPAALPNPRTASILVGPGPHGVPAVVRDGPFLLFWGSLVLLGYTIVGYPILIALWARLRPRPLRIAPRREPSVSILVTAQDEASQIAARLENLLRMDYPQDRVEILLASDGSQDQTAEIARGFQARGVRVFEFSSRRGKPAILNSVGPKARGEILVFADARQRFEQGALKALVEPFQDPQVGTVTGELIIVDDPDAPTAGRGLGIYWRYEKSIRKHESRIDSSIGATGAIYAIRRGLLAPIPEDTVLDDVVVPMGVVRHGSRAVFEEHARAYDRPAATPEIEFERKARTLAGCYQLFFREAWLLNPWENRLFFETVSHKGLRLLLPLLLLGALVGNALLVEIPFYGALLACQTLFYGAALLGHIRRGAHLRLLGLPYLLVLLSVATAVGFLRAISGSQKVTWVRSPLPGRSPRTL